MNQSGINPTEYKVLILPKKAEEVTKGGIIIPDQAKEKEEFGAVEAEIVAASPLAFTYENWPDNAPRPKVGDRVIYARYSGAVVTGKDGQVYRLVNDKDICAVLD